MNNKKIFFLHGDIFEYESEEDKIKYFLSFFKLNDKYKISDFVWDENKPDLLFVSEHLYYGKNTDLIKKKFLEFNNTNIVSIFVAGECIEPDFNLFDYAIVFDRNMNYADRTIRIPFFVKIYKSIFEKYNKINSIKLAEKELKKKKKFCNFIYSNGNAHPMRDNLFYEISKYKLVDSLGSHLRNVTEFDPEAIKIQDWRLQSIKYKEPYKFSISSENASYPGYISEKIFTSFQAHSIPIYFGDPEVAKEFNSKAFINYFDFNSMEEMVEYIKKVDEDDILWMKIIKEPWVTPEQEKNHNKIEKEYYHFFKNIFNKDLEQLKRKSIGFHPDNYRKNLFKTNNSCINQINKEKISLIRRIFRKIIPLSIRKKLKKILKK